MNMDAPLCPQCEAPLDDDFGIVDCKSCGAVCSVDLNGDVNLQGGEILDDVSDEVSDTYEADEELVVEDDRPEAIDYFHEQEESSVEAEEVSAEAFAEEEVLDDKHVEIASEPIDYLKEQSDFGESVSETPLDGATFLKDLEVFTEESGNEDPGHIYYDLHVYGIDTKKIKDLIIETVSDERLELDSEYLESLIQNGQMTIPKLSFLRLQVVYKRLLSLPVELDWVKSADQNQTVYDLEEEEASFEDNVEDSEYQ